jgi:hypothetical protein
MLKFASKEIAASGCPCCGVSLDKAANVLNDDGPKENDISICVYCGSINKFGPGMIIVKMEKAELDSLPWEFQLEVYRAQSMVHDRNKQRRKNEDH